MEEMSFNVVCFFFSIFNSGGHFVQPSRTTVYRHALPAVV